MRLKAVVLPDPFGPISAVIDPSGTTNEQPSTARRPPKRFSRPLTSSSGRPAATSWPPGAASRSRIDERALEARADDRRLAAAAARARAARATNGTIPCGMNSTTSAISPPKISRRELPPPSDWLASSLSGSMMNAPSTGPHSVPRPPSSIDRMICTEITMSNIPRGSMKVR